MNVFITVKRLCNYNNACRFVDYYSFIIICGDPNIIHFALYPFYLTHQNQQKVFRRKICLHYIKLKVENSTDVILPFAVVFFAMSLLYPP